MKKIFNLFHTIKYLKYSQIYYRVARKLMRPKVRQPNCMVAEQAGNWVKYELYKQKLFDSNNVVFLNRPATIEKPSDWNDPYAEKLWIYNVHYFDDLNAINASQRKELQIEFINKWIVENPPPIGNGWEPYPTSLRVVNWIKSFLSDKKPSEVVLKSLAQQVDYLAQNLERHLLGNHLFVNGKALIFAGLYFDGPEADEWISIGLSICDKELEEQVLSDGGNFELSPMYHNIMLTDLIDLINVGQAYKNQSVDMRLEKWREQASIMLGWMNGMLHPDEEIAFFNDAAFDIAPAPPILKAYGRSLGLQAVRAYETVTWKNWIVHKLESSGYIRLENGNTVILLDCAKIGPDYLPAHAHADTLSFEMSLFDQRVFINSGTSCYGSDVERCRQRSTSAHNTVVVNSQNSSEVWGGFRVARRAYPSSPIFSLNDQLGIRCSHDGYLRLKGKIVHHRTWNFGDRSMEIEDTLNGDFEDGRAFFHLHPSVSVRKCVLRHCYQLILPSGDKVEVEFKQAKSVQLRNSCWHPEFGKSVSNLCLDVVFDSYILTTLIKW